MREKKSITFLFAAMFMCLFFMVAPVRTQAAEKCIVLNKNITYKYNLDGKGAKEKIRYTIERGKKIDEANYLYTVKAYVNGKCFYSQKITTWSDSPISVMVTDVNKSDKTKELLIVEGVNLSHAWSSEVKHIRYYQYDSGKMSYIQDLISLIEKGYTSNLYRVHGISDVKGKFLTIDGKGNLKAKVCLQFDEYDYKHIERTVTLKNGKFMVKATADTNCTDIYYNDYKMTKDTIIYKTAGGKKSAAVVKKGKTAVVTGIYRDDSGKLYFKVKYGKKYGYIVPSAFLKNAYALGCHHV